MNIELLISDIEHAAKVVTNTFEPLFRVLVLTLLYKIYESITKQNAWMKGDDEIDQIGK